MKKYGLFLVCLVFSLTAMSQKAVINFDVKSHDFGKVNEEDGKVTYVFDFINKGNAPLAISRVQASCGCTTPTWTKEPIEPGKKGSITVTYNPQGRPGMFTKTITVYSNATDEQIVLVIKGEVVPQQAVVKDAYPVTMNGLSLKSKVVQMNNINKGGAQARFIEIKNATTSNMKLTFEGVPSYLSVNASPETLAPNAEGKITFTFDTKKCSSWGPVNDNISILINGQKSKKSDNSVTVYSNIVEDFSRITINQKRNSPILEMSQKSINLGVLKSGQKKTGSYKISNKGLSNLEIRRIINTNIEIKLHKSSMTIGSGKTGVVSFELNTQKLPAGSYKKTITLQTNDPQNSFIILMVDWTVQ
ncbi:MAG: DUF1573 domain-containing protein [Paludibacter sp.]|nr:DUF1573 domain-containing protein [Paludibacter sp.]